MSQDRNHTQQVKNAVFSEIPQNFISRDIKGLCQIINTMMINHGLTLSKIEKIVLLPDIAWPTIILVVLGVCLEFLIICLLYYDVIHKYFAFLSNSLVIYALFTPMHDASHGSVARNNYRWLNTVVGHLAASAFPVPFPAFKYLHLQHHKHTNITEKDPDCWASTGPWYILPFKWFTLELHYYYRYISESASRPLSEEIPTLLLLTGYILFVNHLTLVGLTEVAFWGWVLPGRTALALLGCFFDYFPHRSGHDDVELIGDEKNIYLATSVTSLYEKETKPLTWPLFHQNYHNIHHLIPFIPFYYYSVVWDYYSAELLERGTKVVPIISFEKGSKAD
jgi:beta-carotene hydroxylase